MHETRRAAAWVAARQTAENLTPRTSYPNRTVAPTGRSREQQIAERRDQMPRAYRATYSRAIRGKSLRAAVNAFCLECVCWQIQEVRTCTDQACPLWAVRPYHERSQNGRDGQSTSAEAPNGPEGG